MAAQEMEERAAAIRKILITEPDDMEKFQKAHPAKHSAAGRNNRDRQGRAPRGDARQKKPAGAKRGRTK